jgi:asparagine synthase (glutamine-hydrolysing)
MCGITGIIAADGQVVDSDLIHRMCAQIIYRGPDAEGVYVNGPLGLGMRRLSIIDLATGQQPIHNEDKTVWVVFNGEIYNFEALRKELQGKGHSFYTNSDTEVIVHAYEEFGPDCAKRFRGMFAYAIYDSRRNKLVLARDRFGKKPLHYALDRTGFYFGSEIKSLLKAAPWLADVDESGLAQYFCYGYIPDPATAFKAIRKLPPAHYLEFTGNKIEIRQYWDLPTFCSNNASEQECLERLESTLETAVKLRLISEVPLGALLSGGVDSAVVVAMMARLSAKPVKTFTIGFGHQEFNEAAHARAVAEKFKTEHHELLVEADLWSTLRSLTEILDEPFADSSIIPTFHVSRIAREHVTVALSGDGGDELFAGYDGYFVQHQRRYLDAFPSWGVSAYHRHIYPLLPQRIRRRKLAYNVVMGTRDRFVSSRSLTQSHDHELSIFSPDFLETMAAAEPASRIAARFFDQAPATDVVSRMQYTDIKTYMTGDVLAKVDRMSMACSLEVRSPLLDHEFAEFAVTLPLQMKMQNKTQKYLLRKLAEKIGVPRNVLYRPKQGFSLPLKHWLRTELRADISSILLEPRTLGRGYLRKGAVERLLDEHTRADRDHSTVLWQMLLFELWHRNYLASIPLQASAVGGASAP